MARVKNCLKRRTDRVVSQEKNTVSSGRLIILRVRMRGLLRLELLRFRKRSNLMFCNLPFLIGADLKQEGSNLISLNLTELTSSVEGLKLNDNPAAVEIDYEISSYDNSNIFISEMGKTKQTARKGANFNEDHDDGKQPHQGIPARFPHKGKPTGKAAMHMQAGQDEDYTPSEGESSTHSVASGRGVQ